jgi:hypothetical protein
MLVSLTHSRLAFLSPPGIHASHASKLSPPPPFISLPIPSTTYPPQDRYQHTLNFSQGHTNIISTRVLLRTVASTLPPFTQPTTSCVNIMPIVWNAETEAKARSMSLNAIRFRNKPTTHSPLEASADQPARLASRWSVQSLRYQGRHSAAQRAR